MLDIVFNPLSLLVHVLTEEIVLDKATLNRPANWGSAISGTANMNAGDIPISAVFAWDYVGTDNRPEEVWNITLTAVTAPTESMSIMEIQDGGAQVYIYAKKVTTSPTADYIIRPEYINLYDRFVKLMKEGHSYVDATTPRLIQEITESAEWNEVEEYKI